MSKPVLETCTDYMTQDELEAYLDSLTIDALHKKAQRAAENVLELKVAYEDAVSFSQTVKQVMDRKLKEKLLSKGLL